MTKPFDANPITIGNWDPVLRVRKKPVVVHAVRLNFDEGFEVTTPEGKMRGKPGDYLMIGVDGEKYPIDADIFRRTYDVLDGDDTAPRPGARENVDSPPVAS